MPLYTSVLTAEQYGVAELLNNTVEIVLPITTLCIIDALYRFSIDEEADNKIILNNTIVLIFLSNLLLGIICFVIHLFISYQYTLHFYFLVLTATLYKMTTQFARGLAQTKKYSLYGVINASLLVIFNYLFLVAFRGGVEAYLISFSLAYGISGIIAFVYSKEYKYFNLNYFNFSKLLEMLKYSIPNIFTMISWWIYSLSSRYVVMWYWGASVAGLYTAGSKLPAVINLITTVFQMAWQYSTALEIKNKDSEIFFSSTFRVFSYLCVLSCSIMILLNRTLCGIMFQSEFYSVWKFTPILLMAATFGSIGVFFGTFYNALKNNKMLMVSTVLGGLINLILNIILIPRYSVFGAAISTAVSYFVVMVVRIIDVSKVVQVEISIKRFILQLICLFIVVICGCFNHYILILCSLITTVAIFLSEISVIKRLINHFI